MWKLECLSKEIEGHTKAKLFSPITLAASYRYGCGALRKEKFMVSRLNSINRIYRKLFAGELAVDPPQT